MNTKTIIEQLPFSIPENIITKFGDNPDLSSILDSIRLWVHFNKKINHEKRLEWHKPILNLAIKNKLHAQEAKSLTNMAKIYDRLGEFDNSIQANKKSQKIWLSKFQKNKKYHHDLVISYCDLSVTYRLQNKLDLALNTLYEGYEILKQNGIDNSSAQIILYSDLGIIYEKVKDYPAALNMFNKSIGLINSSKEFNKNIEVKIICHINIANIYRLTKKLNDACVEYKKAIAITLFHDEYYQHQIISNINLGQTLVDLGDYKKAIQEYKNILPICKKSGSEMDLGFLYILISEAYLYMDNVLEYKKFISNGKEMVIKAAFPTDLIYLNKIRSKYFIKIGQINRAIDLLKDSEKICIDNNLFNHLVEVYNTIYIIFENNDDKENAIKFMKKYIHQKELIEEKDQEIFLNAKQQSLHRMAQEIKLIKESEEKKLLRAELKYKNREIASKKLNSVSNRDFITKILKSLSELSDQDGKLDSIKKTCENQINNFSTWEEYLSSYEKSNPNFMSAINKQSDILSQTEIRVCTLIHLGMDNYEIAELMSISKRSIEQHRYRIKKKLDIDLNLNEYILSLS